MMQKIASLFRTYEEELPLMQLLGPLFLLFTLSLAGKIGATYNFDLLAIAALGLFLSAKWQIRGCVYALALLACSVLFKHLFLVEHHALQFGLEGSVLFALLISGMAFEEGNDFLESLHQKLEAKEQTIQNLEEEIARNQEEASKEQIAATEKLSVLSQTLEDTQADSSALQVLNEVLRKSTAKALEDKERLADSTMQAEWKVTELASCIAELKKEVSRLNESSLAKENAQLLTEANSARVKEAQTHLINETLVRLHAKESQKVKELEERCAAQDLDNSQLQQEISFARRDAQMSAQQVEQLASQVQSLQEETKKIDPIQTERNFLRERLAQAEQELTHKTDHSTQLAAQLSSHQETVHSIETLLTERDQIRNQLLQTQADLAHKSDAITQLQARCNELSSQEPTLSRSEPAAITAEKEHLLSQLAELRTHLAQHTQTHVMYKQLRAQFEEKDKVLHQTRAQLFHADTHLQTLKQELEHRSLETDPVPSDLRKEMAQVEEELALLAEENRHLHELVSHLMSQPLDQTPPGEKKN